MTRTLADMTPAERQQMIGMWATFHGSTSPRPVIIWAVDGDMVWRLSFTARHAIMGTGLDQIIPRFDLPRAWTPSGEPVPGEWQYHPAYTGVYQDGTTSLNLIGVETYSKQHAEWECADIHRDDPAVHFFPVRRYATDWEEA